MIDGMLTDTATWTKGPAHGAANQDEYGRPAGASSSISCRVEQRTRRVSSPDGTEHVTDFTVFTQDDVREGDKLLLWGVERIVRLSVPTEDFSGTERVREVSC
jgi:hypothetical protein